MAGSYLKHNTSLKRYNGLKIGFCLFADIAQVIKIRESFMAPRNGTKYWRMDQVKFMEDSL